MSLQDEHLKQALQSAPDHDLAPSEAVRKKVFAHVQATSTSKNNWLHRWFSGINHLQLAGVGTIASVVIVMLMIYPEAPDDSVWSDAGEADIALTDDKALEKSESIMRSNQKVVEAKRQLSDQGVADKVTNQKAAPTPSSVAPTKKPEHLPKENARLKQAKKAVTTPIVEEPDHDLADDEQMEADAAVAEVAISAEADGMAAETPIVAAAVPQNQANEKKAGALLNKRSALAPQSLIGAALAKQDIANGRLRILMAANTWPEGQTNIDEDTGFNIELSTMSAKEVAAYNAVVRNWHRENR